MVDEVDRMIKTCNAEYWRYLPELKPEGAPCGVTFDDVDHNTHCPHDPLPPQRSVEELEAMLNAERAKLDLPPLT